MTPERRPTVILAVLAGLLVLIFIVGAGFGAARDDRAGSVKNWTDRLKAFDPGKSVDPAILQAGAGCGLDAPARRLTVVGSCQLTIPAAGGRFSLSARRLILAPAAGSVTFRTTVEDQALKGTVSAGDEPKKVGFGRGAAVLVLSCPTTCVVLLPE